MEYKYSWKKKNVSLYNSRWRNDLWHVEKFHDSIERSMPTLGEKFLSQGERNHCKINFLIVKYPTPIFRGIFIELYGNFNPYEILTYDKEDKFSKGKEWRFVVILPNSFDSPEFFRPGEKIFSKNPESRRWLIIGVTTPRYKVGKVVSQAEGRLLIACLLLLTLPLLRLHTPLAPFVLLFHEPSLVVR